MRSLQEEGFEAQAASTGGEALEAMRQDRPDVVLLDLKLPGMDGPTVLKNIRADYGTVPVIIVTGYPDSDLMTEALRYSPLLMLPKPVEHEQLLEAVRLAMNGSKAQSHGL